jgi:hypothetical protein
MKQERARSGIAQRFAVNRFNKWFYVLIAAIGPWGASPLAAQQITVDITPGHATNAISPMRSLGAGIDRDPLDSVKTIYAPTDVARMLSAGWGGISYRLNTELSIQAWHWNPQGQWSDKRGRGYFVGARNSSGDIQRSFGYNLPHRGTTANYGTSSGYSVVDDGDLRTYWKSNPYLSEHFTGENDALHAQWMVVDLGAAMPVSAIRIAWANPYAVNYQVQFWTGDDPIGNPAGGTWKNFPRGVVRNATGRTTLRKLASTPVNAEFVRVWMTVSSGTCDTHGSGDLRNCLGYAMREIYVGTINPKGRFVDAVHHAADSSQTLTYASSIDPWHDPAGIATDDGEQPGFDVVYKSGITRGLPMTVPVAMLYDNPENAANEIAYLEARGYAINYVELGEEPDGQFVLPEDDAALYVQWADAVRAVDPNIRLAGPVFEGVNDDIPVWPDESGNTSWFTRFLNYLRDHGRLSDLNLMTFEHYPFDPCNIQWGNLYQEPELVRHIMKVWRDDGLPAAVPMQISESNLAFDTAVEYMQPFGALWVADYMGSFLTAGGQAAYYYQDEPIPMYHGCGGWGTFGMFQADNNYHVKQATAQYFAARMLTQEWAEPVDLTHQVYRAKSDVKDGKGNVLVTSYALLRPDGQWAMLLVNKDRNREHPVEISFHDAAADEDHFFHGNVTQVSFGAANYAWHPHGANGYADPDGPMVHSLQAGGHGTEYLLPATSITVLRGKID